MQTSTFNPLPITKPLNYPYLIISNDYNVPTDIYNVILIENTAGAITVTLPTIISTIDGYFIYIQNSTLFTHTVTVSGSDTISGSNSVALAAGNTLQLICSFSNSVWNVLSNSGGSGPSPTPIVLSEQIFVDKSGNDLTGNGSLNQPYLTIGKAMSTASTPSYTYVINVGVGTFTENVTLKPNVTIKGTNYTVIGGNVALGLWVANSVSGLDNVVVTGNVLLNVSGVGTIYLDDVTINGTVTWNCDGFASLHMNDVTLLDDITCTSGDVYLIDVNSEDGLFPQLTYNGAPTGTKHNLYLYNGNLDSLNVVNTSGVVTSVYYYYFQFNTKTSSGANILLYATAEAFQNATFSGITANLLTPALGVSYSNASYGAVANVKSALDLVGTWLLSSETATAYVGGGQLNAYQITKHITTVAVINDNDSVKLPLSAGNVGRMIVVVNNSVNLLGVYPGVGEQINNGGVNIVWTQSPGVVATYYCGTSGNYYTS